MQWKLYEIRKHTNVSIFNTRHANTQYWVHIERNQKKDHANNNNGKLGKLKFSIRFIPEKKNIKRFQFEWFNNIQWTMLRAIELNQKGKGKKQRKICILISNTVSMHHRCNVMTTKKFLRRFLRERRPIWNISSQFKYNFGVIRFVRQAAHASILKWLEIKCCTFFLRSHYPIPLKKAGYWMKYIV